MPDTFEALLRMQGDDSGLKSAVASTKQQIGEMVAAANNGTEAVASTAQRRLQQLQEQVTATTERIDALKQLQTQLNAQGNILSQNKDNSSAALATAQKEQLALSKELVSAEKARESAVNSLFQALQKQGDAESTLVTKSKELQSATLAQSEAQRTLVQSTDAYTQAQKSQLSIQAELKAATVARTDAQKAINSLQAQGIQDAEKYRSTQVALAAAEDNLVAAEKRRALALGASAAAELALDRAQAEGMGGDGQSKNMAALLNDQKFAYVALEQAARNYEVAEKGVADAQVAHANAVRKFNEDANSYNRTLGELRAAEAEEIRLQGELASATSIVEQRQAELTLAKKNAKTSDTELAQATKAYEQALTAQGVAEQKVLEQQKLVEASDKALAEAQKTYQASVTETNKIEAQAKSDAEALAANRKQLTLATNELKTAQAELSNQQKAATGTVRELEAQERQLAQSSRATATAAKDEGNAYATVGTHVAGLAVRLQGAQIGLAGFGAGLTMISQKGENFLSGTISQSADFEKQLLTINAVMGTQFSGTLDDIRQLALGLGRDTVFTAQQAADTIETLVKAGMDWTDISTGAARATLNLAAATGEDLAGAAAVATTAMNVFGFQGKDMAAVTDTITKAVNASKISAKDFQDALVNMGPIAQQLKIPFDDVAKSIAALGNVGVAGGTAGTALRNFWLNMVPRTSSAFQAMEQAGLIVMNNKIAIEQMTKAGVDATPTIENLWAAYAKGKDLSTDLSKATDAQIAAMQRWAVANGALQSSFMDAKGDITDMGAALKKLYDAVKDLPDDARLAALANMFKERGGSKAAAPFVDMFDQIEKTATDTGVTVDSVFADITANMDRAGGAADIQTQIMSGLSGRLEYFKGSWSALLLEIGSVFQSPLAKAVDFFSNIVNQLELLTSKNPQLAQTIGYIIAFATAIAGIAGPLTLMMAAAPYVASAFSGVGLAILPIIAILGALTVAGLGFYQAFTKYGPQLNEAFASLKNTFTDVSSKAQAFGQSIYDNVISPLADKFAHFLITELLPDLGKLGQWFADKLPQVGSIVNHAINEIAVPAFKEIWKVIKDDVVPIVGNLITALLKVTPGFISGFVGFWKDLKQPILDIAGVLKDAIVTPLQWIGDNGNDVGNVIGVIAGAFVALKVASTATGLVMGVWQTVLPILTVLWSVLTAAITGADIAEGTFDALNPVTLVIGAIIIAIGVLIAQLTALKTAWDTNFLHIQDIAKTAAGVIVGAWNEIADGLQHLWGGITTFANALPTLLESIGIFFLKMGSNVLSFFQFFASHMGDFVMALGEIMGGNFQQGAADLLKLTDEFSQELAEKHKQAIANADAAEIKQQQDDALLKADAAKITAETMMGGYNQGLKNGQNSSWGTWDSTVSGGIAIVAKNVAAAYNAGYTLMANYGNGAVNAGNQALTKVSAIYNAIAGLLGLPKSGAPKVSSLAPGQTGGSGFALPVTYNTHPDPRTDAQQAQDAAYAAATANNGEGTPNPRRNPDGSMQTPIGASTGGPSPFTPYTTPNGAPSSSSSGSGSSSTKTAAQTAGDAVKAVAEAITQGVAAFKAISQLVVPANLQAQADKFAKAATVLIMSVQSVALQFTDAHLTTISAFGDAGGKVVDFLSKFVTFMQQINKPDFTLGPVVDKVTVLIAQAHVMMNILASAIGPTKDGPGWDESSAQLLGDVADAGGKTVDFLSKFVDFVQKINAPSFELGPVVAKVQVLIAQAHIMMNLLGSAISETKDGPGWTEDNAALLGQVADAGGKTVDFLSKFVDFTQKINAPTFTLGPVVDKATVLVKQAHIIMNQLGSLIGPTAEGPGWTSDNATLVGNVADAGGKTFDFLSKFVDFVTKISAPTFSLAPVVNKAHDILVQSTQIMGDLKGMVYGADGKSGWNNDNLTLIGQVADTSGKVFDAIGKTVDAAVKMATTHIQFGTVDMQARISSIILTLYNTIQSVGNILDKSWQANNIGDWADAGDKVLAAISATIDGIVKLTADKSPYDTLALQKRISEVIVTIYNTILSVRNIVSQDWTSGNIGDWAGAGQAVMGAISATVDAIVKMVTMEKMPSDADIKRVAQATYTFYTEFATAFQAAIDADAASDGSTSTTTTAVAGTASAVVALVSSAYDALQKLTTAAETFRSNPAQYVGQLVSGIITIVKSISSALTDGGLGAVLDSIDATQLAKIAPAIASITGAFDVFTKLTTFTGTTQTTIDIFKDSMIRLLKAIPDIANTLAPAALDAANEFGTKMGPALSVLSAALDLFLKFTGGNDTSSTTTSPKGTVTQKNAVTGGFLGLDEGKITEFVHDLLLLIQHFKSDLLDKIAPGMLDLANDFAAKIGPALTVLQTALGIFTGIGGTRDSNGKVSGGLLKVDPDAIGAFMGDLYLLLHHWHNIIIGGEFQGDFAARSLQFANTLSLIVGAIQKVVDLAKSVGDAGGVGKLSDTLGNLATAMYKTASSDLPKVGTAFTTMFGDLATIFTQAADPLNPQSPMAIWGGKDIDKSFLGRLLFGVEGKKVGIRWWIYYAFQGMFEDLYALFTTWGGVIVKYWDESVLGQMELDTSAFIQNIQGMFSNLTIGVPGTSGGGNNGNGSNPPGNVYHGGSGSTVKLDSLGSNGSFGRSGSTTYNIRSANFTVSQKDSKQQLRKTLQRAMDPA